MTGTRLHARASDNEDRHEENYVHVALNGPQSPNIHSNLFSNINGMGMGRHMYIYIYCETRVDEERTNGQRTKVKNK